MQRYSVTHTGFICVFPVFSVPKYQLALLLYTYERSLQRQAPVACLGRDTKPFSRCDFSLIFQNFNCARCYLNAL